MKSVEQVGRRYVFASGSLDEIRRVILQRSPITAGWHLVSARCAHS